MSNQWVTLAKEAIELEKPFQANRRRGANSNVSPMVKKGTVHFMVSAPHAVIHYRNGIKKLNEPFTGALALQLHERTGANAIIHARTTNEDPNWDKIGLYKTRLKELVKDKLVPSYFVLDLHGLSKQ
jgi:hypothetical protein